MNNFVKQIDEIPNTNFHQLSYSFDGFHTAGYSGGTFARPAGYFEGTFARPAGYFGGTFARPAGYFGGNVTGYDTTGNFTGYDTTGYFAGHFAGSNTA